MQKIVSNNNKTLKLLNVFLKEIKSEEFEYIDVDVKKMESYIKSKGTKPIGPLVQYIKPILDSNKQIQIEAKLLRQTSTFINHIDPPYKMESIIRIPNCMYCRYTGPEEKLKFAYDKLLLTAFEEDINLKGDSYTIFVNRDEEKEIIIADVFMERADNE